jgi:hypothetical protein
LIISVGFKYFNAPFESNEILNVNLQKRRKLAYAWGGNSKYVQSRAAYQMPRKLIWPLQIKLKVVENYRNLGKVFHNATARRPALATRLHPLFIA